VGVKKSRPDLIAIVFIIISGSLVYSNVLHGPFLVDDIRYIRDNPTIRELSGFLNLSGTRYIAFLSFALNYAVGGPDTFGYHLVNMVIHILNGILVYLLVTALFSTPAMEEAKERWSRAVAFTASILFTVHPLQTQAVSYITQRFTSLAAFFYLSAVLLYILSRLRETGGRRAALYALAFLSGLLAQKTKEISFTLPAAIALVEAAFFTGGAKRRILRVLPFVILFAVIPIELFMPGPGPEGMAGRLRLLQLQDMARFSTKDYFLTELPILVTYLRLVFLPAGQTIDHDYTVYHSFFRAPVVASFFFLSVLFFGALYVLARSRRGRPLPLLASFGVVWFFMTISVESSIVPIKDAFFEHRLYLPGAASIRPSPQCCSSQEALRGCGERSYSASSPPLSSSFRASRTRGTVCGPLRFSSGRTRSKNLRTGPWATTTWATSTRGWAIWKGPWPFTGRPSRSTPLTPTRTTTSASYC
jgi:hypothetical protein